MRTSKMISSISYNTKPYLLLKLNELIENHTISFFMGICHHAEEDELKDHIHLYLEPNQLLDTMTLQEYLREPVPNNLPLGCINFRKSDPDDWILYDQHYPPYLAFKNQERKFIYQKSDFFFSDHDTFEFMYHHAFYESEFAERFTVLNMLNDENVAPHELILAGHVPLAQAGNLNALKYMEKHYGHTDRNGRSAHPEEKKYIPKGIDPIDLP